MTLHILLEQADPPILALHGRLDTDTAHELDAEIDRLCAGRQVARLVFDLTALDYLSSAGIRCFIRARKLIEPKGGKVAIVNPQPGVRKVLDIVKAIPPGGVFASVAELDGYLDDIQKKMRDGD
jgi:anti-anti-sigma factor